MSYTMQTPRKSVFSVSITEYSRLRLMVDTGSDYALAELFSQDEPSRACYVTANDLRETASTLLAAADAIQHI